MSNIFSEVRRQSPLAWLVDPGPSIPREVRERLADQLMSSRGAVIMGALDGLVVSVVAIVLHYRNWFVMLAVAEVVCCILRLHVIRAIKKAQQQGAHAPVHKAALMSIIWCSLQGTMAFSSMRSGQPTLQILSAMMIMGVIGPVCARNYPAPRLAILLVCLCDLPFVVGASTSGNPWLPIVVPMTPPFLYGVSQIIFGIHTMAVRSLSGEVANRDMARRDPLTGLLNRHGLSEILEDISLERQETAMMCLDLDGFKHVNDQYGHHAGDSLLKAVARRLENDLRADAFVVRTGGDEFIVLSKSTSPVQATALAQRLISLVMTEPYKLDKCPPIWIGVSVGVACSPYDATDADTLHRKADTALYLSKAAGKGVYQRCEPSDARRQVTLNLLSTTERQTA